MTLAGWLAALGVGVLTGVVSGLVGIGGGAIMVPFLYFFLARPGLAGADIPIAQQAVVAHATSLLVIVPISVRGAWLYHRAGRVDWSSVWRMGVAGVICAVLGARVAIAVPDKALKIAFGIFLLASAARLITGKARSAADVESSWLPARTARALTGGAAAGFLSALLGIGGGLVAIPVLIYWLHLPMQKISATSLAFVTFTSTTGVVAYAVSGHLAFPATTGAFTYFHFPAAMALTVGALAAVPLGTEAQLRMPTQMLRYLFAVLLSVLGLRLLILNLLRLYGG